MSKDMWIAEHEAIGEQFVMGEIDRAEAERRSRALGLDPHEITDALDELEAERPEAE